MTTNDFLAAIVADLDPDKQGGRRHIDEIASAMRRVIPAMDPSEVSEQLLDTILRGEAAGYWSSAKSTTVRRGRTTLPKSVVLTDDRPVADKRYVIDVPLRPELASWAANLPLSAVQRRVVLAVNAWLRETGGAAPVVAVAERAYQLLREEKAFDSTPPLGGRTIWQEARLTFDLLCCERIPTPLAWEPTMSRLPGAGPVVCVENHATFRTLLRILRIRTAPPWIGVAWIQGRNTAPLESLASLPFTVTRLDYLGDLDAAGLEIAASACATTQSVEVPAGPAVRLWELLVEQESRPGREVDVRRACELAAWLPGSIQARAACLLVEGRRIPQEALRYDVLETRPIE